MSVVSSWLSDTFLLAGSLFCVAGGVGLVRMPDLYTRMHAASVIETLGVGFTLLGLLLLGGWTLVSAKLVMIGVLVFFVSPTASHALARAALLQGVKPHLANSAQGPTPSKP